MRSSEGQSIGADVDRDHVSAERVGDLHAEAADATGADEHREVARVEPAARRIAWYGVETASAITASCASVDAVRIDRTVAEVGHRDTVRARGRATCVANPPWTSLPGKTCDGQTRPCPARQAGHSPHGITAGTTTCRPTHSRAGAPGLDHGAAHLVAQRQRERMARRHAVVEEAEIRVAHATARDADQHLARSGIDVASFEHHRLARAMDGPGVCLHRSSESGTRMPVSHGRLRTVLDSNLARAPDYPDSR